jgi:hypothetical protein
MLEPRPNGRLYRNGQRTERGIVENLYGKWGTNPPPTRLQATEAWELVHGGDYLASPGSAPLKRQVSVTTSVSTTESLELSLQLGFSADGFSAGFEAKYGYSVTVSDSTTSTIDQTFVSSPDHFVRTVFWQKSVYLDVIDDKGELFTWATNEVWAVIKPDYNSGTEYQSILKPPLQGVRLPGMLYSQVTWFDREGRVVPAPSGQPTP